MKFKKFFSLKISLTLSTLLLIIFFLVILFLFINIQIEIDDMIVFASGIDLIKDIKNSQYIAIIKGEPLKFEIIGEKFKISYTKENIIYINDEPLFKSVKIKPDGLKFLIKDNGTFEFLNSLKEIHLFKENKIVEILLGKNFYYKIKLREDGKLYFKKVN